MIATLPFMVICVINEFLLKSDIGPTKEPEKYLIQNCASILPEVIKGVVMMLVCVMFVP
jgi:hypothetical protein